MSARYIFDYSDYKKFLNDRLDDLDQGKRGSRAKLSRAIGCQTAYTAQVLRGEAQFSLEQGESISEFLSLTDDEGAFLLLLIQLARAGTPKLRARFNRQRLELAKQRTLLQSRLKVGNQLRERDQWIYYSSWVYGALHALVSIPDFQKVPEMAARLGIPPKQVAEALEFLLRTGLVEKAKNGSLKVGAMQIHLGADSAMITKHHMNWRLRAMNAVETSLRDGLHYSSVVSISKADEMKVRTRLVETMKWILETVKDSKEEELCSFSLDFFPV